MSAILPFVYMTLRLIVVFFTMAILLYVVPVFYGIYGCLWLCLYIFKCFQIQKRLLLMRHCTSHRPWFKTEYKSLKTVFCHGYSDHLWGSRPSLFQPPYRHCTPGRYMLMTIFYHALSKRLQSSILPSIFSDFCFGLIYPYCLFTQKKTEKICAIMPLFVKCFFMLYV
jgi:hypothetical protein